LEWESTGGVLLSRGGSHSRIDRKWCKKHRPNHFRGWRESKVSSRQEVKEKNSSTVCGEGRSTFEKNHLGRIDKNVGDDDPTWEDGWRELSKYALRKGPKKGKNFRLEKHGRGGGGLCGLEKKVKTWTPSRKEKKGR